MYEFKKKSFTERYNESQRIQLKYPDRIPVIIERDKNSNAPPLLKSKYLVPKEITISQLIYAIRRQIKLDPQHALYFFIKDTLPCTSELIQTMYNKYKEEDGFLYIMYTLENTFG
jgi:GABA(A) receptor-associated protein